MNNTKVHVINAADETMAYERKETAKLLLAFRYVLNNIDYPSQHLKEYLREGYNYHVGFCNVYEEEKYKNPSYPRPSVL